MEDPEVIISLGALGLSVPPVNGFFDTIIWPCTGELLGGEVGPDK